MTYDQHPIAKIIPPPKDEEFQSLVQSIREHGLQAPGHLYEGKILDGWSRYRACKEAGKPFKAKEFIANGVTPIDFVIIQSERRNLTVNQKAILAVKFRDQGHFVPKIPEKGATKSGKKIAYDKTDASGQAATKFGISRTTLNSLLFIRKKSPELFKSIEEDKMSIRAAYLRAKGCKMVWSTKYVPIDKDGKPLGKGDLTFPQEFPNFEEALKTDSEMGKRGWNLLLIRKGNKYFCDYYGNGIAPRIDWLPEEASTDPKQALLKAAKLRMNLAPQRHQ